MLIRFPADGASNRLDTFDDNRLARDLHQKLRSIEGSGDHLDALDALEHSIMDCFLDQQHHDDPDHIAFAELEDEMEEAPVTRACVQQQNCLDAVFGWPSMRWPPAALRCRNRALFWPPASTPNHARFLTGKQQCGSSSMSSAAKTPRTRGEARFHGGSDSRVR